MSESQKIEISLFKGKIETLKQKYEYWRYAEQQLLLVLRQICAEYAWKQMGLDSDNWYVSFKKHNYILYIYTNLLNFISNTDRDSHCYPYTSYF